MKKRNTIKTKIPDIYFGIFFSIIVHIVLFFILTMKPLDKNIPSSFVIDFIPSEKPQSLSKSSPIILKNQIVDDSNIINNIRPKNTNLLSEKNNSVKKEQIKKGNSSLKQKFIPKKESNSLKKTKQKIQSPTADNRNKNFRQNTGNQNLKLKLDSKNLFSDFNKNIVKQNNRLNTNQKSSQVLNYKPFSRPTGSGARFLESFGSSMYLPNLPDGDLTLLNTKAEHFAVFVRRVATRIFSELRQSGWESLNAMDIKNINSFTEVEATMSLKGKILKIELLSSSGSFEFDNILQKAIKASGNDSNPPSSAKLDDGNIHFLFQAKSWSRNAMTPNGMIGEQRWLFLSTGLK